MIFLLVIDRFRVCWRAWKLTVVGWRWVWGWTVSGAGDGIAVGWIGATVCKLKVCVDAVVVEVLGRFWGAACMKGFGSDDEGW